MNRHWEHFASEISWFVSDRKRIEVGELALPGSWIPTRDFSALFPTLSVLLQAAHTSRICIDDDDFLLFSWGVQDAFSSWLSPLPPSIVNCNVCGAHRTLFESFGGITERSGEFEESWLLNMEESLSVKEAQRDVSFIAEYEWAFAELPGGIPIDMIAYYSISREANGNTTLCHRETGEVLLFAPDHAFNYIVPLEGCPEYTLYSIVGAPTFIEWVEVVARQWRENRLGGRPIISCS